jgi:extradiol dioxygenase family protein|tara:strand:- start:64 stop:489 length:426 start_codon:yes stop_codon:yes gene_type:complete
MSKCFHLAIEGGDLKTTLPFYTHILGCELGPAEEGKWQDIDFWGNELTLHQTTPRQGKGPERERHSVDMGEVCVPHFGIHLPWDAYSIVKESVQNHQGFLDSPYIRFEGKDTQQETFFVEDPNYNVLEIKSIQGTYYSKNQ